MGFVQGLALLAIAIALAFAIVDAVKLLIRRDFWFPTLALAGTIYFALAMRLNIFTYLNAPFFFPVLHAYVITGIIGSLGTKEVYKRFAGLRNGDRAAVTNVTNVDLAKLKKVLTQSVDETTDQTNEL